MSKYNVGEKLEGNSLSAEEYSSIDKSKTYEQYKHLSYIDKEEANIHALPPVPKGQKMYCLLCGEEMKFPDDFSKNEDGSVDFEKADKEFKFQSHWHCQELAKQECDRCTEDIYRERLEDIRILSKYRAYSERQNAMGSKGV